VLNATSGADVYPLPPDTKVNPVMTPPDAVAVTEALVADPVTGSVLYRTHPILLPEITQESESYFVVLSGNPGGKTRFAIHT
jgi:hypothetical protein